MAAAASNRGGGGAGSSLGGMSQSGLVYSVGLERYSNRAAAALSATKPLLTAMQQLTVASDRLSDATSGAIRLPTGNLKAGSEALGSVAEKGESAFRSLGRFAGSTSVLITRTLTAITVIAALSKAKAFLTGQGLKTANALQLASTGVTVLAGKLNPTAGAANAFVNVMKLLPFRLGAVGNSAMAAGLGLGLMSGGISPLSAGLGLLSVGFRGIPGQLGKIVTAAGTAITGMGLLSAAFTAVAASATAIGLVLAVTGPGLTFGVKLAAEAEQAQIAFETMLGSAESAKQLLTEIRGFAIKTPFQESELIGASRALIAFGEEASNIVPLMGRLGDISSGVSMPLGELAELYGKARVQGRLFAMDINQLTGRGIPIIGELAKQFGVAESEIKKLVESGKISFANLEQAFVSLTSEGGRFFGLTAKQSQSLLGLFSTFKDGVTNSLRAVGEELVKTGAITRLMASGGRLLTALTPAMTGFAVAAGHGLSGLAAFSEVMVGAVRLLSSGLGFVSRWSVALKVLVPVLGGVTAALVVMTAAEKSLAIAKAAVLAMSGPKGWAMLAAGVAAAAAATYGLVEVMKEAGAESEAAADEVKKLTDSASRKFQPIRLISPDQEEQIKKVQEAMDRYATSAERLQRELSDIQKLNIANDLKDRFDLIAFDNATGIVGQIKSVRDEIEVLQGVTTVAQQKLSGLLGMGVPSEWVSQLANLQAQRDQLMRQEEWRANQLEKFVGLVNRDLKAGQEQFRDANQIKQSIRDPLQILQDELKRGAELFQAGKLTGAEFDKFALAQGKSFLEKMPERKSPAANQGLVANTSEAVAAIIAATTRRAGNSTDDLLKSLKDKADTTNGWLDKLTGTVIEKLTTPQPAKILSR